MKLHMCKVLVLVVILSMFLCSCLQGSAIGSSLVMTDDTGAVTSQFKQNSRVTFIIVMANITSQLQVLSYQTAQKHDVAIYDDQQKLIWSWSNHLIFDPTPTELTFDPYMIRVFGVFWDGKDNNDDPIPPGIYTVYVENPSVGIFTGPHQIEITE